MTNILNQSAIDNISVKREDLIAICEAAIVPEAKWRDRDSSEAQRKIGELWALLRAGCEYRIRDKEEDGVCRTDLRTIWIDVSFEGFRAHEYAESAEDRRDYREIETYYLPQPGLISYENGDDWY